MHVVRFPGAAYVATQTHRILLGTFPEIHQHLMQRGLAWPNVVIFTDAVLRDRLPQMVPEFLFFGHVFFNRNFDFATLSVKEPLAFVGTESQVSRASRLMDISLLGMTPEVLARDLDPARAAMLKRECDYFALRDKQGEIIPTDRFLDQRTWDAAGKVTFGETEIERLDGLRYVVREGGEEVILDLSADTGLQGPAWSIPEVSELASSEPFSVRILGAAGAFQHVAPSTSYLMTLDGAHYLIDCSPYVHRTLAHFGVGVDQIRALFISHIHDDHTGDLMTFAREGEPIDLYTTREVWACLSIKLAAILNIDEKAVEGYFRFREIVPGTPLLLDGARLDFHDACHSVPCVGVTITVGDEELVITSDTAGHRQLIDMRDKGIIDQARFDSLEALLKGQKVIVDAGEATIHGYIEDFLHLEDHDNLVLAHRHTLPPQYEERFALAQPLQLFELGNLGAAARNAGKIGRTLEAWHLSAPGEWAERFAREALVREPAAGEVVIQQGSVAEDGCFYLVTHGFFDVHMNGSIVAQLRAGDFFGEQALLDAAGKRAATVLATTPGRLLAIPGTSFKAMLASEDAIALREGRELLSDRLRRLWENRAAMARSTVFSGLDAYTLNAFSLRLQQVQMGPEQVVITEGAADDACYLVVSGSLRVEAPDLAEAPVLRENDLFGEGVAGGFTPKRSATVRTLEPCTLLKLSPQDIRSIGSKHPQVLSALQELVKQRHYLPAV
ncbi:cyclic nucleotide-binding domain-containing protein [bacterium]|nr:cyclic nucleotide-binding domain-containing protein [bacterium]